MVPTELPRGYSRGGAQGCMWGSLHGVHFTLHCGLGILHGLPVDEGVISLIASSEASLNHTLGSPENRLNVRICMKTGV